MFAGHNGVDLYEVLGIAHQASPSEVKAAFRQLAKSLHPDCNAGNRTAEQHFAVVHYAYRILGNAEWRAAYDRELEIDRAHAKAVAIARLSQARRWRFWRVTSEMTVATAALTVCFVTGISIWKQPLYGRSHDQPAGAASASANTDIAPSLSQAEPSEPPLDGAAVQPDREATMPPAATTATAPPAEQGTTLPASESPPTSHTAIEPMGSEKSVPTPASRPGNAPSRPTEPSVLEYAERLLNLGDRFLVEGDVASARQYFARAADLGLGLAADKLAETFEADGLARHGVRGEEADPAEAAKWRQRALQLGH